MAKIGRLNQRASQYLVIDWIDRLANESGISLGQHSQSGTDVLLGDPTGEHIRAELVDGVDLVTIEASDPDKQTLFNSILEKARQNVRQGHFGGVAWSNASYSTHGSIILPFDGRFLHTLGNQVRIEGWRRLGTQILLRFEEQKSTTDKGSHPFTAPQSSIELFVAVPAPLPGLFSSKFASQFVETVGAILTLALGRAVQLPHTVFPVEYPEEIENLNRIREDAAVGTLARKGISLDIISSLKMPGGLEYYQKSQSALLAFDAAVRQEKDNIACILFVVAAEALSRPDTKWRRNAQTRRFVDFHLGLVGDGLDTLLGHRNCTEVFGDLCADASSHGRRERLLNSIYDFRSGQVHGRIEGTHQMLGTEPSFIPAVRRGLFADFAELAILNYISSPRSSVVGHPQIELHGKRSQARRFTAATR